MKWYLWVLLVVVVLVVGVYLLNASIASKSATFAQSEHYRDGQFYNEAPRNKPSTGETIGLFIRFFTEKKVNTVPPSVPMKTLSRSDLETLSDDQVHVVKLGHSSLLVKMYGEYWLLDPVFGERASPFSFAGPKRFHPTPIAMDELPPISRVLISHNHYDHLDKPTIEFLTKSQPKFYVPLGVGGDLERWGIASQQIEEFDWWQEQSIGDVLLAFAPTQHFSGRGMSDSNTTLWGSWVIKTPNTSLYFSGDSGYFDGFKRIGERYGPFDLTFIETGAYDKDWADIHMTPEQSVQAHLDVKGKVMMPVHNGTFDLAFHAWSDPLERVLSAANQNNVTLSTPVVGEVFSPLESPIEKRWWQGVQ
ncbi:MBL fold metallo-hydrolase [Marinomonas communis]|uniref:L-ascorbate metabolism protein UlaG (Beta-lactamase superfamily) n=1 Tax=Marinomonas communis TaxID=28254 RepID=A0A4R6X4Q2_9GAMM|nr:MBL fold metallo-hydrolase [Marinomonas communis]TDR06332.1 L-ascorbate metabolism protein UlaG (beta-lactamase superfamily) [Marinomonas communis]